jgi:DNA mismatch repair protein MutS2
VVPVSLDLDSERRTLVISGPNAGGKTVVLKTAGLLALMAQAGIPVPADSAAFAVFDRAMADIGDSQSIANHLSTFSAHALALKNMLETATPKSLILLDEIGSSTEPGEGAALGIAVLEELRRIGSTVIATTHYNRLKIYAESTPGVTNAAMEFNAATLEPTYKILHGLAGASSGLSIAERLGVPADVITAARALLDQSEAEASRYVEELRGRITELEALQAQVERERNALDRAKESELASLRSRHKEEIVNVERRLDAIVKEMAARAARELENVQDDALKRKYRKRLEAVRAEAASEVRREKETVSRQPDARPDTKTPAPPPQLQPIQIGSTVRVHSLGVTGKVARLGIGQAEIEAGALRMWRPLDDLEIAAGGGITLPTGVHLNTTARDQASSEINLLGVTVDEAVSRVDKFLDNAFIAQLPQVRIVHGFGTGALRNAISALLKGHPHVAGFEFAPQSQGGRGVTIATMRD